jgi:HK97 family phage prohead protease
MPYGVGKRDACPVSRPWAVWKITDGGGEQIVNGGCHATRAEALAQQRALYARESASYTPGEEPAMREHLIAPVLEWKTAAGGSGELEGYVSVFGNLDQGGDVVLPGAFKKTLADWRGSKQPLPLIADHDLSADGVIGSVREAKEDPVGLWVRAGFSSTAKAQDIRTKMIEGHLRGMSFTYETVKHYMGQVAGKSARFLQELRLFEATVTPFPMNTLALAAAKASDPKKPYGNVTYADPGYQDDGQHRYPLDTEAHCRAAWSYINMPKNQEPYTAEQLAAIKGRIRAALKRFGVTVSESSSLDFTFLRDALGKALEIPLAAARKAAADALLDEYLPGDESPGDEADGPAGEPEPAAAAAAPDEGTAEDRRSEAARYAHAIIAKPSGPHDGAPGGEPPGVALAGPLAPLEVERAAQEMDRLEADINAALGRST